VSVIDLSKQQVITTLDVGETPEGISYDPVNNRVLVANWGENSVTIIDVITDKVINTINVGDKPRAFGQFILQSN
jgi:YVTN family beta-propeller protein